MLVVSVVVEVAVVVGEGTREESADAGLLGVVDEVDKREVEGEEEDDDEDDETGSFCGWGN